MFGNDSLPSKIYRYGAKPPAMGADQVADQMYLAHQYRNKIVEIELERRKQVEAALISLSPELVKTEEEISKFDAAREAARDGIRKASAEARKKLRPKDLAQAVKDASEQIKTLREKRKDLRTALFQSPEWKSSEEKIDLWENAERKRIRAASKLYWGTYLHVEQSMSGIRRGAPPKFHRWNGDGHLAVQIQGGISAEEAMGGKDTRIRMTPVPDEAWMPGGRKLRKSTVSFRIGSDENESPIFAQIPIVLHRPIPGHAQIKWVHLVRRRIATHCEWSVQFVLSSASGWAKPDCAATGEVGIDVGWRVKSDKSLRVACWTGSDGAEGELALPADLLEQMKKTRDIQSIRDGLFNDARDALVLGLKSLTVPEWLEEYRKTLHSWHSQARLASVSIKWRENRFEGDPAIFDALEAWRKRDKHLYEYEGNLRDQLQNRRTDLYRVFAAKMRRAYHTGIIEKLDLRKFHVLPQAEGEAVDGALREHVRDACLSVLIRCLKESMAEMIEVPAQDTTRLHEPCGTLQDFNHKNLTNTCNVCGKEYDQDENASKVILERGRKSEVHV